MCTYSKCLVICLAVICLLRGGRLIFGFWQNTRVLDKTPGFGTTLWVLGQIPMFCTKSKYPNIGGYTDWKLKSGFIKQCKSSSGTRMCFLNFVFIVWKFLKKLLKTVKSCQSFFSKFNRQQLNKAYMKRRRKSTKLSRIEAIFWF